MGEDKVCFVICPIGKTDSDTRKRSDLTFNFIIKPVVENFGYSPIRADHINESGMITHQIIDYLIKSPLVIADLTDSNPNVFYELAFRHIVEMPYIQMIKSDQKVPFDVSGMRTIPFDIDLEQADRAKKDLEKAIKSIESDDFKAVNPYTLSMNYSTLQNILKERGNIQPDDIADIVLDSVNGLRSMMDEMREDIHNLKGSLNYSRDTSGADINMDDINTDFVLNMKKKLHVLKSMYKDAVNNGDLDKANEIKRQINEFENNLSELRTSAKKSRPKISIFSG